MWLETFNEMRKMSGMSLDELSEKSGVPKGTLTKITSGMTKSPTLDTMKNLVYAMGFGLKDLDDGLKMDDDISKSELEHIKKYRLLDVHGKEAVDCILNIEHRRVTEKPETEKAETKVVRFTVPQYQEPMSAGYGDDIGTAYAENIELIKEPPRGTSFIARIDGDSMEPDFHHGDWVFIHSQTEIPVGKVGVFYMDGKEYIKELGDCELISKNPAYPPRPMAEDVRCQGLVLGICDESYFEQ